MSNPEMKDYSVTDTRRILAEYGITDEIPANRTPCDLNNPIHPVFDRPRWVNMPDYIWNQLVPACKLASRYLALHKTKVWFAKLMLGGLIFDYDMARNYIDDVPISHESLVATEEKLIELANHVQFSFGILVRKDTELGADSDGYTCRQFLAQEADGFRPPSFVQGFPADYNYKYRAAVDLHMNYLDYFAQSDPATRSPGTYTCLSYTLAQVLMHELAHCVEVLRFTHLLEKHGYDYDVRYSKVDILPELGWALEKHIFPMRISGDVWNDSSQIPTGGLWRSDWDDVRLETTGKVGVQDSDEAWAVPVSWIRLWFSQTFWDLLYILGWEGQPLPDFRLKGGKLVHRGRRPLALVKPKLYDLSGTAGQ